MLSKKLNDNKFLVGLYAYLVQSERSLQRSLNAEWSKFLSVYQDGRFIKPIVVLKNLEMKFNFSHTEYHDNLQDQIKIYLLSKRFIKLILRLMFWVTNEISPLTEREAFLITGALNNFNNIIKLNVEPTNHNKIDARQNLYLASLIMKDKFPSFSLLNDNVEKVEHFYQNKNLNSLSIDEIVGDKWI